MSVRCLPVAAALSALVPLGAIVAPHQALAFGCDRDRNAECYEKVATPDVYRTVERPVVVAPGRSEVVREPAVIANHTRLVQTAPARFDIAHLPAQYGMVERVVVVRPATVVYAHVPAQYQTVRETVVVQPAGYRWERQVDRNGRETMCKVRVPAVTREVERNVQVALASRVAQVIPATYQRVRQVVMTAPPTAYRTYAAPTYTTVSQTVVVRQARERVVKHPPVIGVATERVLVKKGSTRWEPVSSRWN